ncbi:MAG: hypothetical protein ACI9LY_003660 [Arenicella sp.]|jgi:hypothetical protein
MNDPIKLPIYIAIWAAVHAALGTILSMPGLIFGWLIVPIMWCVVRQWKYRGGMQLDILREACLVVFFMIYVTGMMHSMMWLQSGFNSDPYASEFELNSFKVYGVELWLAFYRLIIICVLGAVAARWQASKAGDKFSMLPLSQFLLVVAIVFAAWLFSFILLLLGYPKSDLSTYAMACALPLIVVCFQRLYWPKKNALSWSLDGFVFISLILSALVYSLDTNRTHGGFASYNLTKPLLAICAVFFLNFSFSKAKSLYHAHHHRRNKSSTR